MENEFWVQRSGWGLGLLLPIKTDWDRPWRKKLNKCNTVRLSLIPHRQPKRIPLLMREQGESKDERATPILLSPYIQITYEQLCKRIVFMKYFKCFELMLLE